jgi:hypothetical protein
MNPKEEKPYVLMMEGPTPKSIRIDENTTKDVIQKGNHYYSILPKGSTIRFFHIFPLLPLKDRRWDVAELPLVYKENELFAADFDRRKLFTIDSLNDEAKVGILAGFRKENLMVAVGRKQIRERKIILVESFTKPDLKSEGINIEFCNILPCGDYYMALDKFRDQLYQVRIEDNKLDINVPKFFEYEGEYFVLGDNNKEIFRIKQNYIGFENPKEVLRFMSVDPEDEDYEVLTHLVNYDPDFVEWSYLKTTDLFPKIDEVDYMGELGD